jgi:hypothetical protein
MPRSLALHFRTILRRCAGRRDHPFILARGSRRSLTLEAVTPQVGLRVEHPGQQDETTLAFPAAALAQFEGRSDDLVTLQERTSTDGKASWQENGTASSRGFSLVKSEPHLSFPSMPKDMKPAGESFVRAMQDASLTAAREYTGRSLDRILLRGKSGEIVATDGRQLLVQRGFSFPWKEDRLVAAINPWGARELPEEEALIGCNDKNVFVRIGAWTFALSIEEKNRFPSFEKVIPHPRLTRTRLRLEPDDIALLIKQLPRLPDSPDGSSTITIDLGKEVVVRTQSCDRSDTTELKLAHPALTGDPVLLVMNRRYLLHALKLGFSEIEIEQEDRPLCCRDSRRVYLWMPFTDKPEQGAQPAEQAAPQSIKTPEPTKEIPTMPENNNGNGKHQRNSNGLPPMTDPLTEAEAIRDMAGEVHTRLSRLIAALKHYRRQSKAVRAAVEQIRDLPPLVP